MTCALCDRPAATRGRCSRHYARWQRHGDPLGGRWPESPNPWAGRHPCPSCGSAAWTLPAEVYVPGTWRCCSCSVAFVPAAAVAA